MKKGLLLALALCSMLLYAGIGTAAEGTDNKQQETKPQETKPQSSPAKTATPFDEKTTQYFKQLRSYNSQLVTASRELERLNNPDRTPASGGNLEDILNQDGVKHAAMEREAKNRTRKAETEQKVSDLQKSIEQLRQEMLAYYGGIMPKNVNDQWQNEMRYTDYLISRSDRLH